MILSPCKPVNRCQIVIHLPFNVKNFSAKRLCYLAILMNLTICDVITQRLERPLNIHTVKPSHVNPCSSHVFYLCIECGWRLISHKSLIYWIFYSERFSNFFFHPSIIRNFVDRSIFSLFFFNTSLNVFLTLLFR